MALMEVFLSYSGDIGAARDVADSLERHPGFRVFLAEQLQPGTRWEQRIHDALRRAHVLIVICSNQQLQRSWVGFEVGFGVGRDLPILPLTLDVDPGDLPSPFSTHRSLSIKGPRVTWEKRLLEALAALPEYGAQMQVELHSRDSYDAARGTIEERLGQVKRRLSVSANDGALVIGSLSSKVATLLEADVDVRVMCVDPRATRAVQTLARIDPRFPSERAFREAVALSLRKLRDWRDRYPNLQYRLLPFAPGFGLFISDPRIDNRSREGRNVHGEAESVQ